MSRARRSRRVANRTGRRAVGLLMVLGACSSPSATDDDTSSAFRIVSNPVLATDHNREWSYPLVTENGGGEAVRVSVSGPSWMALDTATATLRALAGLDAIGVFPVQVNVSAGASRATQSFNLTVRLGEILCDSEFGDPSESAYTLPYPAGRSYVVIQSFCPSNPAWGHYNWFAYDFDLAIGDSVVTARPGRVIAGRDQFSDGTRVCGEENLVYVQHDDGSVASYVHLTRGGLRVTVGQRVDAGDLLGLSGDSGCSSGPHLHFAVFRRLPNLSRQYTLPINFRNATGALSSRGGLQQLASYRAR